MDNTKKRTAFIVYSLIALAVMLTGLMLMTALAREMSYGHFSFTVADAYTSEPVRKALIVLPESDMSCVTDDNGKAELFGVPIDMKSAFIKLTGAQYGEITVIIYSNEHTPCVWLKVHAYPGKVVSPPVFYLFPKGSEDVAVTVFTQAPDEAVMERFVREYYPSY